jgi:hypothetical protein
MRAQEFLIEYVRDKTAQALGDKLISALANSRTGTIPDSWYNWQTLVNMALHPEKYRRPLSLNLVGKRMVVAPVATQHTTENDVPTAADVLPQLKPQLVNAILAEIENHDPTANKEYTQWLARVWANANGKLKMEDLNRGQFEGGLLSAYTRAKRRKLIKPEHADINRFKTYGEFERAMMDEYDWDKIEQSEKNVDKGESKEVYRDADVRVIVPEDERAACYYGQGTQWCTASSRNNMFKNYQKQGPLYILLPQKPDEAGEKYQLQFGSNQFMNARDEPVRLSYIFSKFPGFKEWAAANIPEVQDKIEYASDELVAKLSKPIGDYILREARKMFKDWDEGQDADVDAFYEEIRNIVKMTPDQIRAAADEYADPYADDVNAPDLSQLPAIFGLVIEDKLEDSYDVSELVHNLNQNVQVRQDKRPASSGEWNVRVNGMFTLRNK